VSTFERVVALKHCGGSLQDVHFTDLAKALLDAKDRYKDKNFRSKFPNLLARLSFYEYVPTDVIARLVPCFDVSFSFWSKLVLELRCILCVV